MRYRACFHGAPNLFIDNIPHVFPFKKAFVLSLILIVEEKGISKDKLCEYLWADKAIEKGRRNLSNALSYVKKILPVEVTKDGTVLLSPDFEVEKDTDLFASFNSLTWTQIKDLSLPFMDLPDAESWESFEDWLLPKREHYNALLVDGLKERAAFALESESPANKDTEEALRCYEYLSELEPYDEKIHGELVRLYIKTDQKIKAVSSARDFSKRIESDFGIESDLSGASCFIKRNTPENNPFFKEAAGKDSPLARNKEIMLVLDFLQTSGCDRVSSCAFVWGEQGIGKTVFAAEIVKCLGTKGWDCLIIKCLQEEKYSPMAPFLRLAKNLKKTALKYDEITSVTEMNYSYLADVIYDEVAETDESKRRLFIIEDIQWMDKASWIILEAIIKDSSAVRHLIVTGFEEIRDTFMLRSSIDEAPFDRLEISLKRFSLEETARICRETCPLHDWDEQKFRDIYLQSEGNPFFIKELIGYGSGQVPSDKETKKNIFLSMIELLDDEERLFLDAIAISGAPASMRQTACVMEISPLAAARIYDNVRLHGFLQEQDKNDGDVLYYFTHVKIREALLSVMSHSRKIALHLKYIQILESMNIIGQYRHKDICSRLFRHCASAGIQEKELFWRIRELELHFRAAHEVFPPLTNQDLAYYIPGAGDIDYTERALAAAWDIMDKLFRQNGGTPELLKAERDLYTLKGAYLWWNGQYDDSRQMLDDAIKKAVSIGEAEPIIFALIQMCYLAIQMDDAELLSQNAESMRCIAQKENFQKWLGISYRFLGISGILSGDHDRVEEFLLKSTKVFEDLEEKGEYFTASIIAAEHFRGDLHFASGSIKEALEYYVSCINIGESLGLYRGLGLSFAKASFCMMLLGNYDDASKYLQRTEKFFTMMHSDAEEGLQGGGIAFSLMGLLYCKNGDWDKGRSYFDIAMKFIKNTKRPAWRAIMYWAKLELYSISQDMPPDFAAAIFEHKKEWYEESLRKMLHKVGWDGRI